jgi:flagellar biosynthesis/type III secretory pathway protein FliH
MNKEEARQFKARWRAVNDKTAREARDASPATKLQQLALMYEAGQTLGWADGLKAGEEEVRERWRRLREFYRVRA